MDKSDLKKILDQFKNAVSRFEESLKQDITQNDLFLDAAIQRFEFTYELSWKTIKRYLQFEGNSVTSPREVFQIAFKKAWIRDEAVWLDMIDDRNKTSHTYKKSIAMEVYNNLPRYLQAYCEILYKLEGYHSKE